MINRLFPVAAASVCALSAACYPVEEGPSRPQRPHGQATPPPAPTLAGQNQPDQPVAVESNAAGPSVSRNPVPAVEKEDTVITAAKAAGKEGYVVSPYSGKLILVRGIPSDVVLPDQTVPASEKKFIRVP